MRLRSWFLVLVCAASLGACASSAPAPSRPIDTDLAVATFDTVWTLVDRHHFDPDHMGVDWAGVRDELRPRAFEVQTNDALRRLLGEMLGRIGLSHFGVIEGSAIDAFDATDDAASGGAAEVGIGVRLVDDRALVWRVREDSPADRAGVGTGWIVTRVADRDLAERIERAREVVDPAQLGALFSRAAEDWMRGAEGSTVEVTFVDGAGDERVVTLEREAAPGAMGGFGNLPPMRTEVRRSLETVDGLEVGVIGFNIWLIPAVGPFDRAVDDFRDADGIVIDLRGNPGGIGAMAMGLAGHFLDERLSLGTMKTRTTSLEFRANPRRVSPDGERVTPYDGPLAILVDGGTMSTSEIFARGLQVIGRARVFGQPSPGAALPSVITRLPNGDGLQYAFADFVDPDGVRLEKNGVPPDVIVPLRREDLLAGRDAPLEAALEWIALESGGASR